MAESEKTKTGPPESPTTARELDFDDEDVSLPTKPLQPTSPNNVASLPADSKTAPQAQTRRQRSAQDTAEQTLREAFPAIEASVIKAVLVASGGQVEPAFNALLGLSDPGAGQEPPQPQQPPRPAPPNDPAARTQLEADEIYARQLAEHYHNQAARSELRDSSRDWRDHDPHIQQPQRETGLKPNELYDDREHSFIDDDLPVIRENIRKGFLETQSKVNSFLTNLKKKIDGEDEDEIPPAQPPRPGAQGYGIRQRGESARRSADRERYDADPEILSDDFATIHMHDEDEMAPQRRSPRPQANPDLFKPTPAPPGPEKKVSFSAARPQIIDGSHASTTESNVKSPSPSNKNKWQPLASVDPHPVGDHDPFSLGDSDDEEPKRNEAKVQADQKGSTEANPGSAGDDMAKPVEPAKEGVVESAK